MVIGFKLARRPGQTSGPLPQQVFFFKPIILRTEILVVTYNIFVIQVFLLLPQHQTEKHEDIGLRFKNNVLHIICSKAVLLL